MSEDQIAKAVLRGVRLDEKVPGSGLGLNIVSDLAEAYRGSLIMGRAELGGLAASLAAQGGKSGELGIRYGTCFSLRKRTMTDDPWALCHLDDSFDASVLGTKGPRSSGLRIATA